MILSLPIYECEISFHLFVSLLIYFIDAFEFSVYKVSVSLVSLFLSITLFLLFFIFLMSQSKFGKFTLGQSWVNMDYPVQGEAKRNHHTFNLIL